MYTLLKVIAEAIVKLNPSVNNQLREVFKYSPKTDGISEAGLLARIHILGQISKELESSYIFPDNEYSDAEDQESQDSANVDLEEYVLKEIYKWMCIFIQKLELTKDIDKIVGNFLFCLEPDLYEDVKKEDEDYYYVTPLCRLKLDEADIQAAQTQLPDNPERSFCRVAGNALEDHLNRLKDVGKIKILSYLLAQHPVSDNPYDITMIRILKIQLELMKNLSPECFKLLCTLVSSNQIINQYNKLRVLSEINDVFEEILEDDVDANVAANVRAEIQKLLKPSSKQLDVSNPIHIILLLTGMVI